MPKKHDCARNTVLGERENRRDAALVMRELLINEVLEADVIVLAVPVHNFTISSTLENLNSRTSHHQPHRKE